ncbi:MAG: hypothetical protein C4527_22600 [Candidatus Omnitrophota bacterium]|nr:MAG: hypothetical protein C4527_22600 [Candidatus Omnitrophota bacterium]
MASAANGAQPQLAAAAWIRSSKAATNSASSAPNEWPIAPMRSESTCASDCKTSIARRPS